MLWNMLAQDVTAAPQVPGLSPTLQFILLLAGMLIPLAVAILKARQHGQTLDTMIAGVEIGSEAAKADVSALVSKATRGEAVTPAEIEQVAARFKSGIQQVATADGVEAALAPRVREVTKSLDLAELAKRLVAPLLLIAALVGCASIDKGLADLPPGDYKVSATGAVQDDAGRRAEAGVAVEYDKPTSTAQPLREQLLRGETAPERS